MADMIERVARAIGDGYRRFLLLAAFTDDQWARDRELWLPLGRAAVEAMMEATDAMHWAALDADLDIYWSYAVNGKPGHPKDVWRAMIKAALDAG